MRNLFTIFAIFLGLGIAEAQTKEETEAWIKEKLEKYPLQYKNVVTSIDACKINIEEYADVNGRVVFFQKHMIPTNPKANDDGIIVFDGRIIETIYQGQKSYGDRINIFNSSREADLDNRMLKALRHLNTFCEKKKETF